MNSYFSNSRQLQKSSWGEQNAYLADPRQGNQFSFNSPNNLEIQQQQQPSSQQKENESEGMYIGANNEPYELLDVRRKIGHSLQFDDQEMIQNQPDLVSPPYNQHAYNNTSHSLNMPQLNQSPLRNTKIISEHQRFGSTLHQQESRQPSLSQANYGGEFKDSLGGGEQGADKVQQRLQAQNDRLRYLDNYRIICEKRIRELAPTHPLPVLPSHCGQSNPDVDELKQKVNSLVKQQQDLQGTSGSELIKIRQKYDQIYKEKQELEEILRNETLANEEQRNYIQILKNVIDQKMESLGLGELLNSKNLPQGQDSISIYAIISELKKESDYWKKECKNGEEVQMHQQENFRQDLEKLKVFQQQIKEFEMRQQELDNEIVDLKNGKLKYEEQQKVQEKEKNELLDYIEENSKMVEKLSAELNKEKGLVQDLKNKNQGLIQQAQEQEQKVNEQEGLLEEQNQVISDYENQLERFKDQIKQFKKENEVRQMQMSELERKVHELELKCQKGSEDLHYKESEVEKYRSKCNQLESENFSIRKENERILDEKGIIEKRAQIEEESLRKRIKLHEEFAKEQELKCKLTEERLECEKAAIKIGLEQKLESMSFERDEFRNKLSILEKAFEEMKKIKESLSEEREQLSQNVDENESMISQKKGEIEELKQQVVQYQRELEQYKNNLIQTEDQLQIEKQRREWLSQEREKLSNMVEELRTNYEREMMEKEVECKKKEMLEKEIVEQREYLTRELTCKTENNIQINRQADTVKSELNKTLSQLDYFKGLKLDLEQRLNDLSKEYDTLGREKKIFEKQIKDLRDENQILFKNEDRVKRLIEENEVLKSDLRSKEREYIMINDKVQKLIGECENYERENKKLIREIYEKGMLSESLEKQKQEISIKFKEIEKRCYEVHREKQDLEMRTKSLINQHEQSLQENDTLKRMMNHNDDEKVDIIDQMQKLRRQATDQTIVLEKYQKEIESVEQIEQKICAKIKAFLDQFLSKVNNSEILQEVVSRHTKEQSYLLNQSIDNLTPGQTIYNDQEKLSYISKFQTEFSNCTNLFVDIIETLLNETLTVKTDFKLIEKKVVQLENRLGSLHTSDLATNDKVKFLQNELEEQRLQKMKAHSDINKLRDQEQQLQQQIRDLKLQLQELDQQNQEYQNNQDGFNQEVGTLNQEGIQYRKEIKVVRQQMKQKENRVAQAAKEKQQLEELVSKIHSILVNHEQQRIVGELFRNMKERFKSEFERIQFEDQLDQLEEELNDILNCQQKGDQKQFQFSQGQQLRRQINELEQKVRECDQKINSQRQKETLLYGELKSYELTLDQGVIQSDQRTKMYQQQQPTYTISSLNKENMDLRKKLEQRSMKTKEEGEPAIVNPFVEKGIKQYDQTYNERRNATLQSQERQIQQENVDLSSNYQTIQPTNKGKNIKLEECDYNPSKLQSNLPPHYTSKQQTQQIDHFRVGEYQQQQKYETANLQKQLRGGVGLSGNLSQKSLKLPQSNIFEVDSNKHKIDQISNISPQTNFDSRFRSDLHETLNSSKDNNYIRAPQQYLQQYEPSNYIPQANNEQQRIKRDHMLPLPATNTSTTRQLHQHTKTLSFKDVKKDLTTPNSTQSLTKGFMSTATNPTQGAKNSGMSTPLQSRLQNQFSQK